MKIYNCPHCNGTNIVLDKARQNGQQALICKDCGAWIKWCGKSERYLYTQIEDNNIVDTIIKLKKQATEKALNSKDNSYYLGENNAYRIVLGLLQHKGD